jgi:hypothetical protein
MAPTVDFLASVTVERAVGRGESAVLFGCLEVEEKMI